MFDWYKKLFGEGKIRFEATFKDGSTLTGKMSYIGDIGTFDKRELKNRLEVDIGKRIDTLKILGA